MPVSFSSGDDYEAGDGISISSVGNGQSYNDPYEAELAAQAAAGGSGGILGAGFNFSDDGDSGQPSLADLQRQTAINTAIRQRTGLGSVPALAPPDSPVYASLGNILGFTPTSAFANMFPTTGQMPPMPTFSQNMLVPSGISGFGNVPAAPVVTINPDGTKSYTINGVPVTEEQAEAASQMRGDMMDLTADPTPSFGSEMFGKVKSFFTGEEPDPTAGFKEYGTLLNMGGKIDRATGDITAKVGKGELKYNNRFGFTTYSGPKDDSYRGPFENLIRPTSSEDKPDPIQPMGGGAPSPIEEQDRSMIREGLIRPEGGYFPTTGRFLRLGLLDQPIDTYGGLLAGQDPAAFEAMNMAFRRPTNVEYFQDPYDMTGYTLI